MSNANLIQINMYDLLICLTNAGALIRREITRPHRQVAFLAFRLGEHLGLPEKERKNLMLAGLLHDIGAFSLDERLELIENEPPTVHDHAFRGARLLESFSPLANAAEIIRYHHLPWENGKGGFFGGQEVSDLCHILHLADRVAVSINRNRNVIGQIGEIQEQIRMQAGCVFKPEFVNAFMELSTREYIWLDMDYKSLMYLLPDIVKFDSVELELDDITSLTRIFANIIDFRNPFTFNHSAGVAVTASALAGFAGFSEAECIMMLVAGYLLDLGKLAVSNNILNKPGFLNEDEMNVIRSHTFFTFRLLQAIRGFETINKWASFHHERMDGKGYPFHLDGSSIPLGSRIMAVADVFTAITEDRPYRAGMDQESTIRVLQNMAEDEAICPYVLSILLNNLETVNALREKAQENSKQAYNYIMSAT